MLIRLFGKNFRSLRDPFELSMVAADYKNGRKTDTRGVVEVPIRGMRKPLRLLRCAAIYGPNAAGKSSVLLAARALRWLATESAVRTLPNEPIWTYEPFALDDETRSAPTELGCDIAYDDRVLRYELEYNRSAVLSEKLLLLDHEVETPVIDRGPSGRVGGHLIDISKANKLYVKSISPNVTALSKLAQLGPAEGEESARGYYHAVRKALRHGTYAGSDDQLLGIPAAERFADDPAFREWVMKHLIRVADVGICGVRADREPVDLPEPVRELFAKIGGEFKPPDKAVAVIFTHDGKIDGELPFRDESTGTKKLFHIAGEWWSLAHESATLFADELSASLHPRLLEQMVRAVNDLPGDAVRSQLIFATHDTGLLEDRDWLPPPLRRDQVYFTKKGADGASELYSLAEFKDDARKVHSIRRRYLSGLYGALPSAARLSL